MFTIANMPCEFSVPLILLNELSFNMYTLFSITSIFILNSCTLFKDFSFISIYSIQ
uniref:Uncharacterized protein n=1 Tax=Clostridium sp. RKD TaxID=295236 RepID=Q5ZFQ4_9CLOT|nr:hypothetical protein [Clostridium sp. RKD]